eukprot:gene5544-6229_t
MLSSEDVAMSECSSASNDSTMPIRRGRNAYFDEKSTYPPQTRLNKVFKYFRRKVSRNESIKSATSGPPIPDIRKASLPFRPVLKSLDDLVLATKFTRYELQQMYRGFKNDCPTGFVDWEHLKKIYSELFPHGDSSVYAGFIFNTFDADHDGRITFEDFVMGLSSSMRGSLDEKLKWSFRLYDLDNDGVLTKQDLFQVLDAVYKMMPVPISLDSPALSICICGDPAVEEQAEDIFKEMDRNGDGFVNEEEFITTCLADPSIFKSLAFSINDGMNGDENSDEINIVEKKKELPPEKLPKLQHTLHSSNEAHSFKRHSTDNLFPQPPTIEKYLEIPASVRKARFFQDISLGDVVEGRVVEKWADELVIRLDSVYSGPKRWIKDLKIKVDCDLSEFKTRSGTRRLSDSISDFDIGDLVRGVVCKVNPTNWKITVSFRRGLLSDQLSHIELGAIHDFQHESWDSDDASSYLDCLQSNQCFMNPESVNNLVYELGIVTNKPTFLENSKCEVPSDEFADKLRERQSTKWSMDMVASGVKHFKNGKHNEAMKCFDQALQMHSKNVEAFVARGALKANENLLKSATDDFYKALEIHPSHRNGQKYLCETLITLAKQCEKKRLWKEASRRYKEVLQLNPEHDEAIDRFHQIQLIISQQVLAGKRAPPPVNKTASKPAEVASVADRGYSKSLHELLKEKIHKRSKKEKPPNSNDDGDDNEWIEKVVEPKKEWSIDDNHSNSRKDAEKAEKTKSYNKQGGNTREELQERKRSSSSDKYSRTASDKHSKGDNGGPKRRESASSTTRRRSSIEHYTMGLIDFSKHSLESSNYEPTLGDSKRGHDDACDIDEMLSYARHGHTKGSYEKKQKRDRDTCSISSKDKESSLLPKSKLKSKHLSSDEIGFISQLLSKKP